MSLFDLDNSRSSSSAGSTSAASSEEEVSLPLRAPPLPSPLPPSSVCAPASLSVLEQRRRMAELDAAGQRLGAGAQWRGELRRPTAASSRPGLPGHAVNTPENASKFGHSIAAALNLRREEKEKALLKKLQQQRTAEEGGEEGKTLAQKDLDVGVFVTASYRALLRRSIQPSSAEKVLVADGAQEKNEGHLMEGTEGDHTVAEEVEDDDGPLTAYLRQLEGQRPNGDDASLTAATPLAASTGDYYDQIMKAPLQHEARAGNSTSAPTAVSANPQTALTGSIAQPFDGDAPPSLSELQILVGAPEAGTAAPAQSLEGTSSLGVAAASTAASGPTAHDSVADEALSAVLAHARLVYDVRERRRQQRANTATVQACAKRCDDRIAASLFVTPD